MIITPSILSADLAHLQDEVDTIEKHADWIQIDVMDGHFVQNLSFGAPVIKHLKTHLPLDIHLMVSNPEERIEEFLALRAKNITFHAEAVPETDTRRALIGSIRDGGASAGIALSPDTPIDFINDVAGDVDLVLIMSVHPGFGGQAFIASSLDKVRMLRRLHPGLMIQIDGGINADTAKAAHAAGCDNLVSGSFIFSASDRGEAIRLLRAS